MMKKTLVISFILCAFSFSAFASKTSGPRKFRKKLSAEQREAKKAKWQERYDNATPEQQARMDEKKAEREARRAARGN